MMESSVGVGWEVWLEGIGGDRGLAWLPLPLPEGKQMWSLTLTL